MAKSEFAARTRKWRSDLGFALIGFLFIFLLTAPAARLGYDPLHDGLTFKASLDVSQGAALYRDTYNQYGPLPIYIQALALWLFGQNLAVCHLTAVFALSVAAGCFTYAWQKILPRPLVFLSIAIWALFNPAYGGRPFLAWSSCYALAFQGATLIATHFAWSHFVQRSKREFIQPNWFFVGVLVGLTALCRQPVGAAAGLGILALLGLGRRGLFAILNFLGGCVSPFLIWLLVLLIQGSLSEAFSQSFELPRYWITHQAHAWENIYGSLLSNRESPIFVGALLSVPLGLAFVFRNSKNRLQFLVTASSTFLLVFAIANLPAEEIPSAIRPVPELWTSWKIRPYLLWASGAGGWYGLFPILTVAISIYCAFRMFQKFWLARSPKLESNSPTPISLLGVTSILALMSWLQYFPIPCTLHTYWSILPMIGVAIGGLWATKMFNHPWSLVAIFVIFLSPSVPDFLESARGKIAAYSHEFKPPLALAGIRVPPATYYGTLTLNQAIQTSLKKFPGHALTLLGDDAIFLVLAPWVNTGAPLFTEFDWQMEARPDQLKRHHDFIDKEKPLLLVQLNHARGLMTIRELASKKIYQLAAEPPQMGFQLWEPTPPRGFAK